MLRTYRQIMKRNIIKLSEIIDNQKNELAVIVVNSANNLSILDHRGIYAMLTTSIAVMTDEIQQIGKYLVAGQSVQGTMALAEITKFFATPTQLRDVPT